MAPDPPRQYRCVFDPELVGQRGKPQYEVGGPWGKAEDPRNGRNVGELARRGAHRRTPIADAWLPLFAGPPPVKVLIWGLSSLTLRSQIENALTPFGNCSICELVQDNQTGASLGLCRITFAGKDREAQHEAARRLVELSPKIQVGLDVVQAEFDQRGIKEQRIIQELHAEKLKERHREATQEKQRSLGTSNSEAEPERLRLSQEQWVSERIGSAPYIFVSRIGWSGFRSTSKNQLQNHFGAFRGFKVQANATGFFVVFESAKEASRCFEIMNGKSFNGFPLNLELQQVPPDTEDTSLTVIRNHIAGELRDVVAREILSLFVVPHIRECVERQKVGVSHEQKTDGQSADRALILPSFRKKRRRIELGEAGNLSNEQTLTPKEVEDISTPDIQYLPDADSESDTGLASEQTSEPDSEWLPSKSELPRSVTSSRLDVSLRSFQDLVEDDEDFEFAKAAFTGMERPEDFDTMSCLKNYRHLEAIYALVSEGVNWKRDPTPAWRTQAFSKIPNAAKDSYLLARRGNGPVDVIQFDQAETLEAESHNSSREKRMESRRVARALQYNRQRYGMNTELFFESSLNRRAKNVRLARSAIHDWGLYAAEPIEAREFVIEYVGELLRDEFSDARERQYLSEGFESSYLFRIDLDLIVDATKCGNQARFINHSCEPSLEAKIIKVDGRKRIVLYAVRDISPGEELTFDYKFTAAEEGEDRVKCMCGSERCRGYLF